MTENEKKADEMILAILKSQPELMKAAAINTANGRETGDFIAALRARLIEMYSNSKS